MTTYELIMRLANHPGTWIEAKAGPATYVFAKRSNYRINVSGFVPAQTWTAAQVLQLYAGYHWRIEQMG